MSLVAYNTDSDSEESEGEGPQGLPVKIISKKLKNTSDDNISDEEDDTAPVSARLHNDEDLFDVPAEQDLLSLISEKLPHAKLKTAQQTFVDETEDTSTIPEKKDYGDKPEEPPAKKKKRQGPVQIVLPALAKLDEEEEPKREEKKQASKTGSGLFSLLPEPKNSFTRKLSNKAMASAESTAKSSTLLVNPSENNLKPQGVRKVGLVPHRVANPVKQPAKKENSDSEEDEDDYLNVNTNSYFAAPSTSVPRPGVGSSMMTINPVPGGSAPHNIYKYERVPSSGPAPVHLSEEMLGPAVAPYPPPAPAYPDAGQFVESDEAILRLAGKQNKLREMKEDPNMKIVDVNEEDMRGDPRVWLTKAMTEEKAPRPTGKGPKGLARSRHQITYLAHQAKERDWELRQEWATARENKRASANKYGF